MAPTILWNTILNHMVFKQISDWVVLQFQIFFELFLSLVTGYRNKKLNATILIWFDMLSFTLFWGPLAF